MTRPSPQVVVACAWYNRADYIRDTIDSLLAQDFDSFEIVVVNDGSPDPRVREILDSYNDPRLQVIHQENTGFTVAIRRAIDASDAPYIAIQGAGDVSLPSRIREQTSYLHANEDVGVVGCRVCNVKIGSNNSENKKIIDVTTKNLALKTQAPDLEWFLHKANPLTHGEVMFRRFLYNDIGGYRTFFKYAQDKDMWIRMAEKTKFFILKKCLYHRRIFMEDGISADPKKLLAQRYLSYFAIQCYYDRKNNKEDYIQLYGELAGLFRRKSKPLSIYVAKVSISQARYGSPEFAKKLSRLSLYESVNIYSVLSVAIIHALKIPHARGLLTTTLFGRRFLLNILSRNRRIPVRK